MTPISPSSRPRSSHDPPASPRRFLAAAAALTFAGAAGAQQAPFQNCSAARDAGYSNIPSSSPYYGTWLDKDRDGIGCES